MNSKDQGIELLVDKGGEGFKQITTCTHTLPDLRADSVKMPILGRVCIPAPSSQGLLSLLVVYSLVNELQYMMVMFGSI